MNKIKEIRILKKLSQLELAKGIGYSQGVISQWENGVKDPTATAIINLSNYLDVSTDFILGLENDFGVIERSEQRPAIKTEELELLDMFRLLDMQKKAKVIGYIAGLLEQSKKTFNKILL